MNFLLEHQETHRLKFRLLRHDDFENWLPFFDLTDSYPHLFLDPSKSKEELCEFWIDKCLTRYQENRGGLCVLETKDTDSFIGMCGLLVQHIEGKTRLEVGYSLLPKFWGNGYAIEAAQFAKNHAFAKAYDQEFGNSIVSMIHVENKASIQVAIKNCMRLESTFTAENQEDFTCIHKQGPIGKR